MALREIKRRIKSIKNAKKITNAMQLISAAKMKRVVNRTLASRLYAKYSWEIFKSIERQEKKRDEKNDKQESIDNKISILVVLITSNRGLCGSYNVQIIKKAIAFLKEQKSIYNDANIGIISIGKKGNLAINRLKENVIASFNNLPDLISFKDLLPISELVLNEYKLKRYNKVFVIYTDFISSLQQKPTIKQIIPIDVDKDEEEREMNEGNEAKNSEIISEYLFEDNKELFLEALFEKLVKTQIYQAFLESSSSEQSSRMMAMKNATEASEEMIEDFTLIFNKMRQASITQEILEINTGMCSAN